MRPLPPPTADTPTIEGLLQALDSLEATTAARWGVMDALAMAEHCTRFVDLYRGRVHVPRAVRLIARMIGPLFLRKVVQKAPTATPKNLRTLGQIRATPGTVGDLGAAKETLRERLLEVAALEGLQPHKLYGEMEAESVRTLVRHHTAHHFHQFGLLE